MNTLLIDHHQVKQLLSMPKCIALMREALIAASTGDAAFPLRSVIPVTDRQAFMVLMPGQHGKRQVMGAKIISIFPHNHAAGLESHQGVVLLFETEVGYPIAMIDAGAITAIRTAAVSGAATDALAPREAASLAILGSGVQAESHWHAMQSVREIKRLYIWSRNNRKAQALLNKLQVPSHVQCTISRSAKAAVEQADVICATTGTVEPIVKAGWLKAGTHINAVGACTPTTREFDSDTIAAAAVFVDCYESAFREAGEIMIPLAEKRIDKSHVKAELGEVFAGQKQGRIDTKQITYFKSLGIAAEDIVAAHYVWQRAIELGIGQKFNFEGRNA